MSSLTLSIALKTENRNFSSLYSTVRFTLHIMTSILSRVNLLHVDLELFVLFEDPEAVVALDDHEGRTERLHRLLLDGEV